MDLVPVTWAPLIARCIVETTSTVVGINRIWNEPNSRWKMWKRPNRWTWTQRCTAIGPLIMPSTNCISSCKWTRLWPIIGTNRLDRTTQGRANAFSCGFVDIFVDTFGTAGLKLQNTNINIVSDKFFDFAYIISENRPYLDGYISSTSNVQISDAVMLRSICLSRTLKYSKNKSDMDATTQCNCKPAVPAQWVYVNILYQHQASVNTNTFA